MVPKSEYAKVFANNLRRIMHERGKNGADMARYLGVGKSRVSYLPAAGVEPAQSRRVYVRIAESCRNTFQIILTSRECPRCYSRVLLPV